MKIVILTGNQYRHKYFANEIAKDFDVAAVFSEGKMFNPSGESSETKNLSAEEKSLWDWHFGLAKKEEENFFSKNEKFTAETVFEVAKGEINCQEWEEKISSLKPDIIVVYGTSLLRENIIKICPKGIINMHLGLSPYYRGSGTNFWPLYNNEPEYVGVTIHKIDLGIDTGNIIHQARPKIEKGDNQHTIGNKAIVAGTKLMKQAIEEVFKGSAKFYPQEDKGLLYQRKDFNVSHIATLKSLMEDGLVDKYVEREKAGMAEINIIQ